MIKTQNHDRLKSSIHNNQGLMMFLSVSEKSNPEMRIKTLNYIKDCFQKAIKLSENKLINLLYSVYKFKDRYAEINLFFKFINLEYNHLDLNCYLFLRNTLIIELKNEIYHH